MKIIVMFITLVVICTGLQAQTYEIDGCDFVKLRTGPGLSYPNGWKLQKGVTGIVLIGMPVFNDGLAWQKVNSRGVTGWVCTDYLRASVQAAPPQPTPESNDCFIIATEIYGRLKPNVSWVRIAGGRWGLNGGEKTGHAVVFFQLTPNSNVFCYDAGFGSINMETQSHDLDELIGIINISRFPNGDFFRVEDAKWQSE